ncbi:hypothetical protein HMI54_009661 [Coelomomyces lativittatus]|nr:hypothetical protein HMI55_000141 [Coelomomyces lativittatus]KAJ1516391.1 hypothetical protein HMI54_009661 [Coelomomyces lativittatus]
MTTRSRTAVFKQHRQSAKEGDHFKLGVGSLRTSSSILPYESEKVGLISNAPPLQSVVQVGPSPSLPPAWVDLLDEIEAILLQIQKSSTQLETMHRRHLLPGFDDRHAEVAQIDEATRHITGLFKKIQQHMQQFEQYSQSKSLSHQELVLHQNVSSSLACKIQQHTSEFRKMQSNYMSRLKTQSPRTSPIFQLTEDEEEVESFQLTTQQQTQLQHQSKVVEQREKEIQDIAKAISDVHDLFKDMQTLIIDQGSLLDRIDYHIDEVAKHVETANEELIKADQTQASTRKKQLIFLLALVILVLIVFLVLKYTGNSSNSGSTSPTEPVTTQP